MFDLAKLHDTIRSLLPTSPHCEFENTKQYKQLKLKIDEAYDAEADIITASNKLTSATRSLGFNLHYYNYLAPIYAEIFKALKAFEAIKRKLPPELAKYYADLTLPDSKTVYQSMKDDFTQIHPLVEEELTKTKTRNPDWKIWDDNIIDWDKVNALYKGK